MKILKLKLLLLNLLLNSILIIAGNKTDSLQALLPESSGTEKLKILDMLLDNTMYKNLDTACFYANELLKEAEKQNNPGYATLAYRGLGIIRFYKFRYYEAEAAILKAIELQKQTGDTSGLANSYKILTGIYWESERYSKSIDISFKALKLYETINDTNGIISSYNNIGLLYSNLKNYDKALRYHKKALSYLKENNTNYPRGSLYNNTGISYKNSGDYDNALKYYRKSLKEYKKENSNNGIATAYLNIGNIYAFHKVNTDSAFIYLNKALKLSNSVDYALKTEIYGSLGGLYFNRKEYSKCIETYKKSLEIAELNGDKDMQKNAHHDLYKVYKKTNNLRDALTHLEKYVMIKDSLDIKKADVTIANLELKFENEKNILKINKLESLRMADKKIKTLLATGIILLIIIFILSVRSFNHKRKRGRLERELLASENENLEKELHYKSKQLTSQALMMMQKNKLLNEIHRTLPSTKDMPENLKSEITKLKRKLKSSIHSEEDWELFQHYFEDVNKSFYPNLLKINDKLTPAELKLSALIKLRFTIKETASLMNITPDSVKTTRSVLRKKLGLQKGDNIYDFLGEL